MSTHRSYAADELALNKSAHTETEVSKYLIT